MKQYCEGLIQILLIVQLFYPILYFILEVDCIAQACTREKKEPVNGNYVADTSLLDGYDLDTKCPIGSLID